MEISQIIPHVESLIFAADRPLPLLEILDLLNNALAFLEDRATLEQVEAALEAIREKYSSEFYAFEVRESGGGFQFLTKKEYYQTVAQLNGEKFLKRLSTAALETLAIVAYKQPISKGEIEHIRGVSTDYSIQKLLEKELIVISGRSEQLPGKPLLYSTSKAFMDYFGLNSPKDLPKLKEVFDDEGIQPTLITGLEGGESSDDANHMLVVSENGELVEQAELPVIGELPFTDQEIIPEPAEEFPVIDDEGPVTETTEEDVTLSDISVELEAAATIIPGEDEEDAGFDEDAEKAKDPDDGGVDQEYDEEEAGFEEDEEDDADDEEDIEDDVDDEEDIEGDEDDEDEEDDDVEADEDEEDDTDDEETEEDEEDDIDEDEDDEDFEEDEDDEEEEDDEKDEDENKR